MNKAPLFVMLVLLSIFIGCSTSGQPISPNEASNQDVSKTVDSETPFATYISDRNGSVGDLVMAAYEGVIDTKTLDYHFAPIRQADAIGDSFQVDLTYFLDGIPCGNCLRIGRIRLDEDSNVAVTFEVQHPFSAIGPRLDLPVFDVRGILVNLAPTVTSFPGVQADMNADGTPETQVGGDVDFLLNADGYTTFFDLVSESYLGLSVTGNINPYKLFFVDPTQGNFNPAHPNGVNNINQPMGHNVFAQGIEFGDPGASAEYLIKAGPDTILDFLFILDSSYGQSSTFGNTIHNPDQPGSRSSPKLFVPEFNRKEAWKIEVSILENRLAPYDDASTAQIQVSACDWQAGITPSGNYGPNGAFDDIRYASDVQNAVLEIPGVTSVAIPKLKADATGTGSATDPYKWTFGIFNDMKAKSGSYFGMVCVRDEIGGLLDGTTPPFGVKQNTTTVDLRDFAVYQAFTIKIAGLEGKFQADPFRENLDLVTGIVQPTSATVELDLGVVENDDLEIDGIYMPDANNSVTRYNRNYTAAVFHGPGLLPPNTTGTHPNPTVAMPIKCLDANSHGVTFIGYNDANETYQPVPLSEPTLPAGNILHMFYCIIPPPDPPYTSDFPLDRWAGYYMPDVDDPATAAIDESLQEDPLPVDVWDDFEGNMGCVWKTTKFTNTANSLYDILYLGTSFVYPADETQPPVQTVEYSVSLSGIPGDEIKGMDQSDNGYLYYGLSGPNTPTGSLVVGFDALDPFGNPIIGGIAITTGNVVDIELLPYDPAMPRIINDHVQTAPIIAVLTDNKTIEFINAITGEVMQLIDGAADGSITGVPKHLDVGDRSFTVHVTHLDGTTPRVTVYVLK
jgi:hypothetical protein